MNKGLSWHLSGLCSFLGHHTRVITSSEEAVNTLILIYNDYYPNYNYYSNAENQQPHNHGITDFKQCIKYNCKSDLVKKSWLENALNGKSVKISRYTVLIASISIYWHFCRYQYILTYSTLMVKNNKKVLMNHTKFCEIGHFFLFIRVSPDI